MTYTPEIFDWRASVQPMSQVFIAGGQALDGGLTLGGAAVESSEPGGRTELRLEFDRFANAQTNLDASWTASRMLNGAVFRLRLWQPSVQLLSDAVLGGNTELGETFSDGTTYSDGLADMFDPTISITNGGPKGSTVIRVNTGGVGANLRPGHIVGLHLDGYDFAHMIVDVSYPITNRADLTLQPPLRRVATAQDAIHMRPIMLATCVNAREVAQNFIYGTSMTFAPARFVEALV